MVPILLLGLSLCLGLSQGQEANPATANVTRPVFLCGGEITGDSGYVASEGFPNYYPPNKKCVWKITVPDGHVVILSFRLLDMEADPSCRYDYLNIYNGHSETDQRLSRVCGTFRPGAVMSTGPHMMLEMVSDEGTAGRGFLAWYSAGAPHLTDDVYCGGKLDKPQGTISSPNWPKTNYPSGVSCSWHVVAPKQQVIEVSFGKMDIEEDSRCRYDYLAVYNGGQTDSNNQIGKFCGDTPPETVYSDSNELLLQFVSDLSVTAGGFEVTYRMKDISEVPKKGSESKATSSNVSTGGRPAGTKAPVKPKPTPKATPKPTKPTMLKPSPKPTVPKPTPKPTVAKPVTAKPTAKPKPTKLPKPPTTKKPKQLKPAVSVWKEEKSQEQCGKRRRVRRSMEREEEPEAVWKEVKSQELYAKWRRVRNSVESGEESGTVWKVEKSQEQCGKRRRVRSGVEREDESWSVWKETNSQKQCGKRRRVRSSVERGEESGAVWKDKKSQEKYGKRRRVRSSVERGEKSGAVWKEEKSQEQFKEEKSQEQCGKRRKVRSSVERGEESGAVWKEKMSHGQCGKRRIVRSSVEREEESGAVWKEEKSQEKNQEQCGKRRRVRNSVEREEESGTVCKERKCQEQCGNNGSPFKCPDKCRKTGTLGSHYCINQFVLSGSVRSITKGEVEGTLLANINVIHTYKTGELTIQEAGNTMSVQIVSECPRCPILKKGGSYLFMGMVDSDGRGRILGDSFVIAYKAQQHQILTNISKKPC
ncbi:uncharacterized protein PAF06_010357 [Gastrophryne carolinensis]